MPKTILNSFVDSRNVHTIKRDFASIAAFIAIIWIVFFLDQFMTLERYGLVPRDLHGLYGIVAMPFLHGDLSHIIGNTIPLAVTLLLLAGSRANSGAIVLLIIVLGGVILWLFGREARHIGASGLVFGLIAFHIFSGIFEKRFRSILIALIVGVLYAGTLFNGVLPFQQGVSWDGHLFGAIAGGLVALFSAKLLVAETRNEQNRHRPFTNN
jgi:membrane associated rhomboid family serine protease